MQTSNYLTELPENAQLLPCLGAIIGDTVGSIYEFDNIKTTEFSFYSKNSIYTDDSVLTIAVADWLANSDRSQQSLENKLVEWSKKYPNPEGGYGSGFSRWLYHSEFLKDWQTDKYTGHRAPYYSWGNGSAMRVSACGWVARTIDEAIDLGRRSAEITHNHPEGLRGAEATAAAIFLARQGADKAEIRDFIERRFYYDLHHDCDEIRPKYKWEESCQGTVPPAIIAFLDSYDFESAIRLAVSLGGDSDTLACITGSIAQAYYKEIPDHILTPLLTRLPTEFWQVMQQVCKMIE